MKKLIYFTFLFCVVSSCSSQSQSKYEKLLTEFIETRGNIRTDLKVKFELIDISDITVSDSIQILKDQFTQEKTDKISKQEKDIECYKNQIAEIEAKTSKDVADIVILKGYKRNLNEAEESLQKAKDWMLHYLTKYDSRTPDEILVKKAICTFSILDPKLQTRQTYKNALFVLSADGTKPLKAILSE